MKRFKVLSLAALVAFAACDEGSEPVIEPTPTGTISGVVTIEGTARSGVTVTLSSGASATTDGSGAYSFAGVNAGAYTVSISGFPADASFSSTAKAATITAAGQVVTVNFDGAYVRTSAILGSVTAGGQGLAGVSVSIGSASVNTDANGQYAFSGLRAGTYTVTISGFNAGQYTFASTSSTVTLGVGESKVASFTGQLLATASITGAVTIDGAAAAGVTATLSTGAVATTDASGAYAFTNLTAGNYVVTISGYPSDSQFESVAKPVVITSAGSTVTANFAGAYIKTSTIVGTVSVSGTGVGGVAVTLNTGASVNTDANGQYAFAALRAGTYTVTISGWDATQYTFATTSADVTVAQGESAVQNFGGAHVATSKITGSLFIDEAAANGTFDTTEDKLAVAGITIQAEGGAVNNLFTTTTNASGDFMFENLVAGTYRLTILGVTGAPLNPALPTNVAFRAGASTNQLVVVGVGGSQMAHWPFNITRQTIRQQVMLGVEGTSVGTAPVAGASIWLYDTYQNATGFPATVGRLGTATTTSAGTASFNFARAADVGPGGSVDNIVFARVNTLPAAHALSNAENVIEIKYNPKDSVSMSPDTIDAIRNQVVLKFNAMEIDGDPANGWNVSLRSNKDSVFAPLLTAHTITGANGSGYYTMTTAASIAAGGDGVLPDTFWVRLSGTQTANNAHGFSTTMAGDEGSKVGRYARYIWNGLTPAADTIVIGNETITYTDADIIYRAHHEADDSTGVTATYTLGDNFVEVGNVTVKILNADGTTARAATALTAAGAPGAIGAGSDRKFNLPTGKTYTAVAQSAWSKLKVLGDTAVTFTLSGGNQVDTIDVLKGGGGASSFAYKMDNGTITGSILARDGSAASAVRVRVQAGPGNIQGTKDTTVVTNVAGVYTTNANLREGPYTVTVMDSVAAGTTIWAYGTRLTTTTAPVAGSGVSNTDPYTGVRDVHGNADSKTVNFLPDRMDTKIQGVIVNDRDADTNTIDPDEALPNVVVELYKDNAGAATVNADSLVGTSTTTAGGAFSFSNLREGRYIVKPVQPGGNALVLRGLTNGDTAIVVTAAGYAASAITNGNPDGTLGAPGTNGRIVGITTGFGVNPLPAWNYANSTFNLKAVPFGHRQPHFTFLFNNGTATGTVTKTAVAVSGMTISAVKCSTATGFTSPPTIPIGAGTCTPTGSALNTTTNASGMFSFSGLQEGVWLVTANPATAGLADPIMTGMFVILGNFDVETGNFVIP